MTALIVVLGGLTAFGPLSMDLYLPAFPDLARELDASQAQVQLTLTADVVGLVMGQVVLGPLSDAWGGATCCWAPPWSVPSHPCSVRLHPLRPC
jgi:DHA1 family bicyclomycin/chloramphenicol resistance-like MFS transporter